MQLLGVGLDVRVAGSIPPSPRPRPIKIINNNNTHLAVVDAVLLQDALDQAVVQVRQRQRRVDRHAAGLALFKVDVGRRPFWLLVGSGRVRVWW